MNVQETIKKLHRARLDLQAAKDTKTALLDGLQKSLSWTLAQTEQDTAAAEIETLQAQLNQAFELVFQTDGNKKPHPAIQVKEFTVIKADYNPKAAHAWCLANFTPALKLDVKAFEKAAADGNVPDEICIVTVQKEARVQIAADLAPFAEVAEPIRET
jgi:hypothetical protein